jgi:hypothetical protein
MMAKSHPAVKRVEGRISYSNGRATISNMEKAKTKSNYSSTKKAVIPRKLFRFEHSACAKKDPALRDDIPEGLRF